MISLSVMIAVMLPEKVKKTSKSIKINEIALTQLHCLQGHLSTDDG